MTEHHHSSPNSPSQDPSIFVKRRMPKVTPVVLSALLLLVIVFGSIGVVLVQRQLRLAQELRQQASVAAGIVDVVASKVNDPVLNQPFQIKFDVNTHQAQIDGVQLIFNVSGPNMSNVALNFPNDQLQTLAQNVQQVSANNYRITTMVVPKNVGSAYSNNSNTTFMTLSVTPTSYGPIAITYDNSQSLSIIFNSNPPQDTLKTLGTTTFAFAAPASPSPVASPTPSPAASPSPVASPTPSPSPVASPTPSPVASPTPSPSPVASPTPSPVASPTPSPAASPTPSPMVTPSPSQKDDLLMEANNQSIGFYTMSGESISSNSLTIGTQYKVRFNYTIQNIMKSTADSAIKIYAVLQANGASSDASYITYGLVRQHRDGGSGTPLEVTFTAQATNTFEVFIDTTDTIDESNEFNNSYTLLYTASQPGSGGTTVVGCNQSCTSSANCENNLFCSNGQCRLAANPSSSNCSQPQDNGIARSCDEYCSDSRECGSGYTCYYNRCRRPDNVNSNSCSAPVANTYVPNWTSTGTGTGTTTRPTATPSYIVDNTIPSSTPEIGTQYFAPEPIENFASPTPSTLDASPEPTMVDGEAQPIGPMQWLIANLFTILGGLLAIIALIVAIIMLSRNKDNTPKPPSGGSSTGFSNGRPVSPLSGGTGSMGSGSTGGSKPTTSFGSQAAPVNRNMTAATKDNYEEQLQKRISELQLPKPPVSRSEFAANTSPNGVSNPITSPVAAKQPAFTPRPTTPITPVSQSAQSAQSLSGSPLYTPARAGAMSGAVGLAANDNTQNKSWDAAASNLPSDLPSISIPESAPTGAPAQTGFGSGAAFGTGSVAGLAAAGSQDKSTDSMNSGDNSMMSRLKSRGSYNAFVNSSTN